MAISVVDSERKLFISTAMTPNLAETIIRERYRKSREGARLVSTAIKILEAAAAYYSE